MLYQDFNSQIPYHFDPNFYTNFFYFDHLHDDYELIYCFEGEANIKINNKEFVIKEHEFCLVLSNQIHSYEYVKNSYVWIGVFAKDFVKEFDTLIANKEGAKSIFKCEKTVEEFLVANLMKNKNPDRLTLISALTIACNCYLIDNPLKEISKLDNNYLFLILNYISHHYAEQVSLKSISELLHIEQHYLSRYFHTSMHMNFRDFLNKWRVAKVQTLLLDKRKITESAYEVGFDSIRTFNRAFKKVTNMTPREFINANINK